MHALARADTLTRRVQASDAPPPAVPCSASLPNVGNEGHSYLHHMATRHASLAPLTLFLPDTLWNDATEAKPHFAHDIVARHACTQRTHAVAVSAYARG